jgi:hypothetical protein
VLQNVAEYTTKLGDAFKQQSIDAAKLETPVQNAEFELPEFSKEPPPFSVKMSDAFKQESIDTATLELQVDGTVTWSFQTEAQKDRLVLVFDKIVLLLVVGGILAFEI